MSLPSKLWLTLALVTSPLLLAATRPTSPGAEQLSCELSEDLSTHALSAHSNPTQPTLLPTNGANIHPIVHPVGSSQQALVTAEGEWLAFDAGQPTSLFSSQSGCRLKEEPTTEAPSAPTEEPADPLPNLDPAVSPPPAAPPSPPVPQPEAEQIPTPAPAPASPSTNAEPATDNTIPTRPVAPPPSDPGIDPNNFTPETEAPTPFDGIVIPPLSALPDGSYRYLAGNYEFGNYTDEQLIANGGAIFLLTKRGNQVVGELRPRLDQPGVCVTGTVSGNTITGSAYPQQPSEGEATTAAVPADETAVTNGEKDAAGETSQPYAIGGLQIRQPRTVAGQTYYAEALLDLSEFSRINAGFALAPTSCEIPSAEEEG
ncbi:MAG: hypothetical protein AAFP20_05380 [Cyanobacteria bacterium J06614_10]